MFYFFKITLFCLLWCLPAIAQAYDKPYVGEVISYETKYEDTLIHIARDYGLGYVEMISANPGVDPWLPGAGVPLTLPARHLLPDAPHEGIVINLPEMRLYAFVNGKEAPDSYALGIGRDGLETPVGSTKIVRKTARPEWRPTARMRLENKELPEVVPAGPQNPLGTHALYLGWPQYAIHGTNRPFGIGRRVSSGCIRLYPESIKQLYKQITIDTPVHVVDQAVKAAWIDDTLYVEAHADMAQAGEVEEFGKAVTYLLEERDLKRVMAVAGEDSDKIDWDLFKRVITERKGYPVAVASRVVPESSDDIDEP